jgi:von Willebrand factor type A domain
MRTRSRLALAALPCLFALLGTGCSRGMAPVPTANKDQASVKAPEGAPVPNADIPVQAGDLAKEEKRDTTATATATAAASAVAVPATPPPAPVAMDPSPARARPASKPKDFAGATPSGGGGGDPVALAHAAPTPAATKAPPAKRGGPEAAGDDAWRGDKAGSLGVAAPAAPSLANFSGVKAGEWDDNANYRDFQKFLGSQQVSFHPVDLRFRRFLVVRDAQGKPVPRCRVRVNDDAQHESSFFTTAGGHAILFPKGEGLTGAKFLATAVCEGGTASQQFALVDDNDGIVDLHLTKERAAIQTRTVDLAFVLDTTGSMSEEIAAVRQTIQKVAQQLQTSETRVRIGLVEYKDRTDPFVTKVYPFSNDLQGFAAKVSKIEASGGGDTPEDMNAGVHTAVTQLQWSDDSVARMAFVIADAPPHLDYQDGPDYAKDMKTASHRGIQLFTVAASGMDQQGQVVMRQMAQYTGGTNMFVLRGGAGPQSTGGGDPGSSCGGTHQNYASGNLHELIVSKIKHELKSIDGDPMRIAGVHTDENAKPCDQRVVWLD